MSKHKSTGKTTCKCECGSGCGCFVFLMEVVASVLMEMVAFVLICWICGCQWARNAIVRVAGDARAIMQEGGAK